MFLNVYQFFNLSYIYSLSFTSDVGEITGAWRGVNGDDKTSAQHRAEIDSEVASSQTVSVPAKLAPYTVRKLPSPHSELLHTYLRSRVHPVARASSRPSSSALQSRAPAIVQNS